MKKSKGELKPIATQYSNKIDTADMMRHVQFMESKFGSMANVPEDYPELQLLHNQLDTRTDEDLIPEVMKLRMQRKLIPEIQEKLNLSWFRVSMLLNSYAYLKKAQN